ncbi:MaoC family dehydratase N-terminal domain-containing protein [Paenibacillus sp. sgz500958]|uniref:FAS1-like dehydratase domain-containing protein n=1 Tax=Paenibacillus sp. sgz500958 TaxID=3242475 RepID=UPI0036D3D4B0
MNRIRFKVQLTEESIIRYANSIHSPLQRIGGVVIAPSTMLVTFWKVENSPWLHTEEVWVHGSQQFYYHAPLLAGMNLECELSLVKVESKNGRQGSLTLYTHSLICYHQGNPIAEAETVLIGRGDVK